MDGNSKTETQATEIMTGAEIVLRALADQGVDTIFGYPGGAVLPIYDAIYAQQQVRHILVRHEQGAGHMAEGYAAPRANAASRWPPPALAPPTW